MLTSTGTDHIPDAVRRYMSKQGSQQGQCLAQPACHNPVKVRVTVTRISNAAKQMQVLAISLIRKLS